MAVAAFGFMATAEAQTLSISPASGTQLTTTFTLSGSGYTPNGTVRRFINQPAWGGFREITAITANGSGQMSFSYTPICADSVGTTFIYMIDGPTGRQSPTVAEQVAAHPSCVPTISSISPQAPTAGGGDQAIAVSGSGFLEGQTVTVTFPGGGSTTLSGSQVQNVTANSFALLMTLADPGTYSLRVISPNLTQSPSFSFTAQAAPATLGISPTSGSQLLTTFTLSGSGYSPNGLVRRFIHQPAWSGFREISWVGANAAGQVSWLYVPTCADAVGTTYIYVIDGVTGRQSPTVSEQVGAHPSCVPVISSLSPASPQAGPGNQAFTVSGSGFQDGQTVTVTFPGGGSATLSGSQVQNVTATSFTLLMTLADAGTYSLRVNSPNLTQSAPFGFTTAGAPTLAVTPDSGQQITTAFMWSGSGYSPNGNVRRFVRQPTWEDFREISSVTANGAGQIGWTFTPACPDAIGITRVYVVDAATGRQSTTVDQTYILHASCIPFIGSVSPTSPIAGPGDQAITVTGSGFYTGQTMTVTLPGGGTSTLSGAQMVNLTPTSFTALMTLAHPGTYGLLLTSPNTISGNTFNLIARAATTTPTLVSISPAVPTAGPNDQPLTVYGSDIPASFTVVISFPRGGSATLSGAQVQNTQAGGFTLLARLLDDGIYRMQLRADDGRVSNELSFRVDPVAPVTGTIDGRVFRDDDGDGVRDVNEPLLRSPANACGGDPRLGFSVRAAGPRSDSSGLTYCNSGGPHYRIGNLPVGVYTATLAVPSGWQSTGSQSVLVEAGATAHAWFGARPPASEPTGTVDLRLALPPVVTPLAIGREEGVFDIEFSFSNDGPSRATSVELEVHPGPGLGVDEVAGRSCAIGAVATCSLGIVEAGASEAVTVRLRGLASLLTEVAFAITSAETDRNRQNNSLTHSVYVLPEKVDLETEYEFSTTFEGVELNPLKPTIVLTHGWQLGSSPIDRNLIWTADSIDPSARTAKALIKRAVGPEANVVQFIWQGAVAPVHNPWKAKNNTDEAGGALADALHNHLGSAYSQPIHFIGHSYGSVVNAYAARQILGSLPLVPAVHLTNLDTPIGTVSPEMPRDFFAATLESQASGRSLLVEHYFATGVSAFGDEICRADDVPAYNHPPLYNPSATSGILGEGLNLVDHSGVHQWYRWTIDPDMLEGTCGPDGAFLQPAVLRLNFPSLNPCRAGWKYSPFVRPSGITPNARTCRKGVLRTLLGPVIGGVVAAALLADIPDFTDISGCVRASGVINCEETPESIGTGTLNLHVDSQYLRFDFRFTGHDSSEYAAVLVAGQVVWLRSAANANASDFVSSGPVPLPVRSGAPTLSVVFYGAGATGAQFELRNL
jgi:hypothetical protein